MTDKKVIAVEELDSSNKDKTICNVEVGMSDVAYLIYTLVRLGNPKAVMINHSSLSNFIGHGTGTSAKR